MRISLSFRSFSKIALGIASFCLVGLFFISIPSAFAETSEPKGDLPPPPIPDFAACTQIFAAVNTNPSFADSNVPFREFAACLQLYKGQYVEYLQATSDWWYRRSKQIQQSFEFKIKLAFVGGTISAIQFATQKVAYDFANVLLSGGDGLEALFYTSQWDNYINEVGEGALGHVLDNVDQVLGDYTEEALGVRIGLCGSNIDALALKLSLALGPVDRLGPGTCTLSDIAGNLEAIGDVLESPDSLLAVSATFREGNTNDLSAALSVNNAVLDDILQSHQAALLQRAEDKGFKPVADVVSGKIAYPTELAMESMRNVDPVLMANTAQNRQADYMMQAYWEAGLEAIPWVALSTFTNTLLLGILKKIFEKDPLTEAPGAGPSQTRVTFEMLQNEDASGDAQDLFERRSFAKALGDYVVPNFTNSEDIDVLTELSTCAEPRTRFSCAMDTAFAVGISGGAGDGALTVGRAAGIGQENATFAPNAGGLHPEWEMIPERDVQNNTDPGCYQRAYCAGNLKKLRLARILPIGWEMAANSPYNIKKDGKYATLGEVIRGFYSCNDEGKIDQQHPWCHLIDPNWILTAPAYQCRAQGFGDALLPGLGSRLETCGDIATCLGTDQKGTCVKGYGYCLAERPTYKFDTPECEEQFASCRTYQGVDGERLSVLRNTIDYGRCSEENIGCLWYSTERFVEDKDTPDGLWVGDITDGPRVYLDGTAEPCSAEGCTRMLRVEPGQPSFNLIKNPSFENLQIDDEQDPPVVLSLDGWKPIVSGNTCTDFSTLDILTESYFGSYAISQRSGVSCGLALEQNISVQENRYYTLSFWQKFTFNASDHWGTIRANFLREDGTRISDVISMDGSCDYDGGDKGIRMVVNNASRWERETCTFVVPKDAVKMRLYVNTKNFHTVDAFQLEEGQIVTDFVEGSADLDETYLKMPPDEYRCTGIDNEDHPGCQRFARMCRQTDVGCQGYTDVEDPTAPEIPASLSVKDLCPAICSGYAEYRKLPSPFDLVRDPVHPEFNDPDDETVAYFVPNLSEFCALDDVGCEPFTNLEVVEAGGEAIAYYSDIRLCEKPDERTATYFTWEGSDVEGYQLKTWALVRSDQTYSYDAQAGGPEVRLKGAIFGSIKEPELCDEDYWKSGADPDCRQFYDAEGLVFYRFYSQTVSADASCSVHRRSGTTPTDCTNTGGYEFQPQTGSCLYRLLPVESRSCSESAGGCRAYLGSRGRNAMNASEELFPEGRDLTPFTTQTGTIVELSEESVLVGDRSLKLTQNGQDITVQIPLFLSTEEALYRVSFWSKAFNASPGATERAVVSVDGDPVGTYIPTIAWQRFEFGPFTVSVTNTSIVFRAPANFDSLFVDTIRVDQLNDTVFVKQNSWTVPATCDSTYPEGIPEPRAMLGCREYRDRDGNTAFVRQFGNLCSEDAIGCKAFVQTFDMPNPFPDTVQVNGTPGPSNRLDPEGKAYESQFFGDWTVSGTPWRYVYAIDDPRGWCDQSQSMCRALGKPVFNQNRLSLGDENTPQPEAAFETVLLRYDWNRLLDQNGEPDLACRKDELFCSRFQSGNITEYFRNPENHTCEWRSGVELKANPDLGIYTDGEYGGWFRTETELPCYPGSLIKPPYLKNGQDFGAYFSGEDAYSGWNGLCPVDQSECTEFVDPNDKSDLARPEGRSYFVINSNRLDDRSCGGTVDPLNGCILFQNRSIPDRFANAKATYAKSVDERGAPQTPLDCEGDFENEFCRGNGICLAGNLYQPCTTDADCGGFTDSCQRNDANVILKVRLDRECARWMGCRTGETVYDPGQQKFVTQCSELQLCEEVASKTENIYCSRFSIREAENFLTPGQFVNFDSYSDRYVGFGAMDYSGLTAPNQYTLPDIAPRRVGSEITTGDLQQKYRLDQRLTAQVPMTHPSIDIPDASVGDLSDLCLDVRTSRIGYEQDGFCILPVGEAQASTLVAGGLTAKDISRDVTEIYREYQKENIGSRNTVLQAAMPAPECRLYPEATSPLSNAYVESWNNDTSPPKPEKMFPGYENAKACVQGEDCSCSYRKVRYDSGPELYFSVDGTAPPVGVCIGGDRDGSSCVPGGYIPVDGQNRVLVSNQNTLESQVGNCGGGLCSSIQDVVILNGKYGYCLERDLTRLRDASQSSAPCLTWAPLEVLGGREDLTHYQPTAGYMPSQGSGEYYCVSGANQQRVRTPSVAITDNYGNDYWGQSFWAPGDMERFAFTRANVAYSSTYTNKNIDGSTNGKSNVDNLSGGSAANMGFACRRTSLCEGLNLEGYGAYYDYNASEGLWITTGRDVNTSYLEYFIPYIDQRSGEKRGYVRDVNAYDFRFGLFRFSIEPFSAGAACKWNPRWLNFSFPIVKEPQEKNAAGQELNTLEKFSCSEYLQEIKQLSDSFYQQFRSAFSGILDRSSEQLLTDVNEVPLKLGCVENPEGEAGVGKSSDCFFKFWETEFGSGDQESFIWPEKYQASSLQDTDSRFNFWKQADLGRYYGRQCQSGEPFFKIRAMFQNMNFLDNSLSPQEARNQKLSGPWQFVGFWITTCLPTSQTGNPGFLYMKLDLIETDVCRQVAQVISPNTRESAAFMDRVWAQGNFFLPVIGTGYAVRNEPFASALATGSIGHDPMIRGASVPLVQGKYTPTFVDSGVGISPFLMDQQMAWVPLSNLFARIYKVYRWESDLVTKLDWSCVAGDNQGRLCGRSVGESEDRVQALKTCTGYSTCNSDLDIEDKNRNWRCNTLSGVNRGLHCGDEDNNPRNTDPICHNNAVAVLKNSDTKKDERYDLLGACQETDETDFVLTASDLSRMGVCKTYTFPTGNCGMKLLKDKDLAPNKPLCSGCVETNIYTKLPVCSPDYVAVNYGSLDITEANFINQCVYNVLDDEDAGNPTITFGVRKCPDTSLHSTEYYAYPKPDDLQQYQSNVTLMALYGLLKRVSLSGQARCNNPNEEKDSLAAWAGTYRDNGNALKSLIQQDFPSFNASIQEVANAADGLWRLYANYGDTLSIRHDQFGLYARDVVQNIAVFRCEDTDNVVNPGARCGILGSQSPDCPLRINACNGANWSKNVNIPDNQGNPRYFQVPRCGFCSKGDPDDPYKNTKSHEGTGYCKGFNKLARCNTDDDCRFTAFEFWGAYDDPNAGSATGWRYGGGDVKLLWSQQDLTDGYNFSSSLQPKPRRLPTPLFKDMDDLDQDGKTNEPISEVPREYSYPAQWTSFISRGQIKTTLGQIFEDADDDDCEFQDGRDYESLRTESLNNIFDNDDFECVELRLQTDVQTDSRLNQICPIAPMRTICMNILGKAQDEYYFSRPRKTGGGFMNIDATYENVGDDKNDSRYEEFWFKHYFLTEVAVRCFQYCGAMAIMTPNTYAQNLDDIRSDNIQESNSGQYYRKAAVAGFAVNPLIRSIRSMGYFLHSISNVAEKNDDDEWVAHSWRITYPVFWSKGSDKLFIGKAYSSTLLPLKDLLSIIPSYAHKVARKIYDNTMLKDIFTEGIEGKTNDQFPWKPTLYFSALFPLAFDAHQNNVGPVYPLNKNKYQNEYFGYNLLWHGYGYSPILLQKFQELVAKPANPDPGTPSPSCSGGYCSPVPGWDVLSGFQRVWMDYFKQYLRDMRDNYFDQTGWGVFMKPSDSRLQLYPGAVLSAEPAPGKSDEYHVFIPGHCEPPTGGTDSDTFDGEYYQFVNMDTDTVRPGIPYLPWKNGGGGQMSSKMVQMPWMDWGDYQALSTPVDDSENPDRDSAGLTNPLAEDIEWTPSGLREDSNTASLVTPIPGPVGDVAQKRETCRCESGPLDGQIVESEFECNPNMEPQLDPRNFENFGTDWEFCKPVTGNSEYKDKMQTYVNKTYTVEGKTYSYGITQSYVNEIRDNEPIPDCRFASGVGDPDARDPDLDDNSCTHRPGYLPRWDICKDGRDQCLLTYNLTDPKSVNHIDNAGSSFAPSATDVTNGLDTFDYLSDGNRNRSGEEFSSYYFPQPPIVAVPNFSFSPENPLAPKVGSLDAFGVDGLPQGLVYYGGGQGRATIQFYAWAAHNQGPIKSIVIDWGDGTMQEIDYAQLKNNKPICGTNRECEFAPGLACSGDGDCPAGSGACLEVGTCKFNGERTCTVDSDCPGSDTCELRMMFGNSSEACRQGYFEFSHVYRCDASTLDLKACGVGVERCADEPDYACNLCKVDEQCIEGLAPRDGCFVEEMNRCRFTPRVMVKDNWGWCTGDCTRADEPLPGDPYNENRYQLARHPNGGCWDGSQTKTNTFLDNNFLWNECNLNPNPALINIVYQYHRPWIVYRGSVEVESRDFSSLGGSANAGKFNFGGFFQSSGSNLQLTNQPSGPSPLLQVISSGGAGGGSGVQLVPVPSGGFQSQFSAP